MTFMRSVLVNCKRKSLEWVSKRMEILFLIRVIEKWEIFCPHGTSKGSHRKTRSN